MRRASLVVIAASALAVAAPATRADDDAKAADACKKFGEWYQAQNPKTAAEQKVFAAEVVKRGQKFLKDFPRSGKSSLAVRWVVALAFELEKKYDDAIAEYEETVASSDEEYAAKARPKLVRAMILKKDFAGARKRLDAFLKDNKDDKSLQQLDEYLKPMEAAKDMKPGGSPPDLKTKTIDGDDLSLEAMKGKVVLLTFFALGGASAKKTEHALKLELPHLKKLYADLHAKGLELASIHIGEEDEEKLKEFVKKSEIGWPVVTKDGKAIGRSFGVTTVPRSVLIGKDGRIVALDAGILRNEDGSAALSPDELARAVTAGMEGKPYKPKEPPKEKPPESNPGEEK